MNSNLNLSETHSKLKCEPKLTHLRRILTPEKRPRIRGLFPDYKQKHQTKPKYQMSSNLNLSVTHSKPKPCPRKEAEASPRLKSKAANKTKKQNDLKSEPKCYTFKAETLPQKRGLGSEASSQTKSKSIKQNQNTK